MAETRGRGGGKGGEAGKGLAHEDRTGRRKFDVIVLQETWVERVNEKREAELLSEKYRWPLKEAVRECRTDKKPKKGRAKGEEFVGIEKEICNEWVMGKWECGFILRYCNKSDMNTRIGEEVGATVGDDAIDGD
ncbi:hypothetical protein PV326_000939 [Microctonus aethiopoides]|nr:hypothetical protein PV326_000939 [Microctonus aethiopoides]